jgi:hypothetical protein
VPGGGRRFSHGPDAGIPGPFFQGARNWCNAQSQAANGICEVRSGDRDMADPRPVLLRIKNTLADEPDATALRDVRALLDDPAFNFALREYIRGVNDPDSRAEVLRDISAISRACSDATAQRKNEVTNTRYGLALGVGFIVAGTIGLFAGTLVAVAGLFVLGAGVVVGAASWSDTGPLSEEEQIYQDIASRAMKIREKLVDTDAAGA